MNHSSASGKVAPMSSRITIWFPGKAIRPALILVSGVVLAGVLTTAFVTVAATHGDDLAKGLEVPAVGAPTTPVCPANFAEDAAPANSRRGPLIPSNATEALLCSYRFAAPEPMPLTATYRITSGADKVVAYLNGLPTSRPEGQMCGVTGETAHVIVFGYTNRPAAVVYARGCAWDQAGAVRYGGDLRKVTGFWRIPWNQ